MLGLTPDPLSAGVGMRVAVAGPYGHERVTAWQDGADAQRKNTAGGSVSSGRARAPDGALARLSQTTVYDTWTRTSLDDRRARVVACAARVWHGAA